MRYKDVIGRKVNFLTIIGEETKRDKSNNRPRYFLICKCDCGNICEKEKSKVLSGYTKSCGCVQLKMQKSLGSKFKKPKGVARFNEVYGSYKKGAKLRGYEFELTKDQFLNIITRPCIYCGEEKKVHSIRKSSNGQFEYTGIDRYDNAKGYTYENCVPCCTRCNAMKSNMSVEEFKERITRIYNKFSKGD